MIMRYVHIKKETQKREQSTLCLGSQDVFLEKDAWTESWSMSRSLTDKIVWEWHSKREEENVQRDGI